jgi:hypothetical protein
MRYQITVRVRNDNDPTCRTYEYEKTTEVRLSEYSDAAVKGLIADARGGFEETFPHNHALPAMPPIKVTVLEVD